VFPETVRTARVITDTRDLTVSTIKYGHRRYETVVFDDSADKQHAGKVLAGRYVIDSTQIRSDTREDAMDAHREALYAARVEPISA
jgi:hypothetical protein